jgi:hypothetical protein
MSDLLKELKVKDDQWQQDVNRWILEAGEGVSPDVEASMRNTLWNRSAAEITRLTADVELLKTSGIAEVAAHNPSVMDWVKHWEARTLKAEAENKRLRAALEKIENTPPDKIGYWEMCKIARAALELRDD